MFFSHLFVSIASTAVQSAAAQEVALSFDDSPHPAGKVFSGMDRAKRIVATLKDYNNVQAVFFSISGILENGGDERLRYYSSHGHLIANHSDQHLNFDNTSYDAFLSDFIEADRLLAKYHTFRKWFRFPFLREGKTTDDQDRFKHEMNSRGYKNGYVTVDSSDWYMDKLLQEGLKAGKKLNVKALCDVYTIALLDGLEFYDRIALKVIGRSPRHVMLLHEYDTAALCLSDLLRKLISKNWKIIDPEKAYSDPISALNPKTLFCHQGRIAALAAEGGTPHDALVSPWESKSKLRAEFEARKVFS